MTRAWLGLGIGLGALALVACGGDSETTFGNTGGSTTADGGGGTGGSGGATGGAGGVGGSGGSGGGVGGSGGGTVCGAATAAASGSGVLLWTTLDDDASVLMPAVGAGPGAYTGTFQQALSNNGLMIDEDGDWLEFPQTGGTSVTPNVSLSEGSLDFCYRPNSPHTDGNDKMILRVPTAAGGIRVRKAGASNGNALQFIVVFSNGGPTGFAEWVVPETDYTLDADEWYRVTLTWSFMGAAAVRMYIDGTELAVQAPAVVPGISLPPPDTMRPFVIGTDFDDMMNPRWNLDGVIDEVVLYDNTITP